MSTPVTNPAQDGVLSIVPVELRVALTYPSGGRQELSLVENQDMAIPKAAAGIFRNAEGGQIAVALDVDDDHDEVHYAGRGGSDAVETITRGIEVLTVALEAIRSAQRA